ncbi:AAA family ATPase [Candidatus Phytoplasma fraxini]|uniref:AAA family ATPase n=1 Tax=Ash yellows phytoplasma TaxID=35780 RepID=A0ABZ2U8L5_ASHYP
MTFISKKTVDFFVNVFEEIMLLEEHKQTNLGKIKNLNQIEKQIESLNQQINHYNFIFNQQQQKIKQKNTNIETLQYIINIDKSNIQSLKQQMQNLREQLMQKNKELIENNKLSIVQKNSLNSHILVLQNDIQAIRQTLSQKELSISDKEVTIQNLIIQLQEQKQEISEIKELQIEEKKAWKTKIQQKIKQLSDLQQDIQSQQEIIDKLSITFKDQTELLSKKEIKIQQLTEELEDNKQHIDMLNTEIVAINTKLAEKVKEIETNKYLSKVIRDNLDLDIEQLKQNKKELQQKLDTKEFILNSNQDKIDNLMFQLQRKNQEIQDVQNLNQIEKKQLQTDIENKIKNLKIIQEELNISRERIIEFKKTVAEQKNLIERQNVAIVNLHKDIGLKNNVILSLSNKIQTTESNLIKKQQELSENKSLSEQEKQELKEDIDTKTKLIEELKGQLYSKENFLIETQREIENLKNQLDQQEERIIAIKKLNENEQNELKMNIKEKIILLTNLENDLNANQQTIDQFKKTVQEQTDIIIKKQEQIDSLESNIKQKNSDIHLLDENIKKLNSDLNKKTEELLENALLTDEQKKILNEEIENFKKEIQILKSKIKQKENFVYQAEQKISNLEKNLQQQTEQLEYNKLVNNNDKFMLKSKINNQFTSLHQIKTKLDKYKTDIETSLMNNQMFNSLIVKAMSYMNNVHKQTLDFVQTTVKQQESQKMVDTDSVQIFLKKTDKFPTFDKVIGNEEVKEQLRESVLKLKNLDLHKNMGSTTSPKGILLYGPPGTGKTYLAKAFAKEAGLPFYSLTSSDFSNKYVGESPKLIKNLFEAARKNSPSIILIDECEVVFRKRDSEGLNSDHGNVITAFLSQIEGIYTDENKPVFVIATTNFKDDIDNAILSRFNKMIEVDFWVEKDIIIFLQLTSAKYNLDIRTYKYLDNIAKQIMESSRKELRTPRKIIELLEQAASIAISKHEHLNIMPIDLQLSFDRITQKKNMIDWTSHKHEKHDKDELFTTKIFKNTPIKHLFIDSPFINKEKQYFTLIKNGYMKNKKFVYNTNLPEKIIEVEIDQNNLKNINNFYSSTNPLPDDLLGFYFETDDKSKKIKELKTINNLENILSESVNAKVPKIYFIWDIEKIKYNKNKMNKLLTLYTNNWEFFKLDNLVQTQLSEMIKIPENHEIDFEQKIIQYIEEIKIKLINDIYDQIQRSNDFKNLEYHSQIKKEIQQEINTIFNQNKISETLEEIKNKIIFSMQQQMITKKNSFLQDQIEQFINEMSFNKKIFDNSDIQMIKIKMIENIYNYFINKEYFTVEKIQNKINEIKNKYTEKLFKQKWSLILQKLNIDFNLDKDKIINKLEKITKEELFYANLDLNQIIEFLNKEAAKEIQILENNLNQKISENINRYILLNKDLNKQFSNQEIELINKGAVLIAKDELKKGNIKEDEIYEKINYFIKNYKTHEAKFENSKDIFSIITENFYWLKFVLIIIICKYFFQSKKN